MAELVADCPRCNSNKITFDVRDACYVGEVTLGHGALAHTRDLYETFCFCRNCEKTTIFELVPTNDGFGHLVGDISNFIGSVSKLTNIIGYVSIKNFSSSLPPEFLPPKIDIVFREGASCFSIGCYNASAAMFRLCLDLCTKDMLPDDNPAGLNGRVRRNLGLRLPWLFENDYLPPMLKDLSNCIREDGNDGAHDGTLTENDAADIKDFTYLLLEHIYTVPERLRLAASRRVDRRQQ